MAEILKGQYYDAMDDVLTLAETTQGGPLVVTVLLPKFTEEVAHLLSGCENVIVVPAMEERH